MTDATFDHFRAHDPVLIQTKTLALEGFVHHASANGRSLILSYDGIINGWIGQLPAFFDEGLGWATLDGTPLTLRRL